MFIPYVEIYYTLVLYGVVSFLHVDRDNAELIDVIASINVKEI